jgi:hypothetical protein
MTRIHAGSIVAAAASAALLLVAAAPAQTPEARPVIRFAGRISPDRITRPTRNGIGTPVSLTINSTFTIEPEGAADGWVITRAIVNLPGAPYAVTNSHLFPSCDAKKINANRGSTRVCPRGSQIGSGKATGTAVDLRPPITSSGAMKVFNGPRGRSVVFHFDINRPAKVITAFDAPLKRTRNGYQITLNVPPELQDILDSRIIVRTFNVTTRKLTTTQVIRGRRVTRGYIEGLRCPPSGRAGISTQIFYREGFSTRVTGFVPCRR